jgi:hypothetical protein
MDRITRIRTSIYVALIISVFVALLTFLSVWAFSFLGYGVLLFVYGFILTGLILFYWWTSILTAGWTILAFFINFIAWSAEQILFEKQFHNTILYQKDGITQIFVLTFGAILFALNKVLIDEILIAAGVTTKEKMRIHVMMERRKEAANEP